MPAIPLIGYAPDLPSNTPGIVTDCTALIPSLKGMKGAPSPQNNLLPALAAACRGAGVVRKLDNSTRLFAGTTTKLYEAGTSSWTDMTNAGGDYNLGSDNRWRFAQRGDESFAAAKSEILQYSTSGAFVDADSGAPKAAIVEIVNGFIILGDVNDQGGIFDSSDRPHGWWAARTASTWTPSVTNEAYTGELTSTPGKIRAIRRFGQVAIIYKDRSMYTLTYGGANAGWVADLVPGEAGAVSQEAVVDVGTSDNPVHISMGLDDFYRYDGARPVRIGSPVKEKVFGELNKDYSYACIALHDRVNSLIYFYYPVGSSINPDKCVVYNYKTDRWGRDDRQIEAAVEYVNPSITYDDLGTYYATYGELPNLSYDTAFVAAGYPSPSIFNTLHRIQTLSGSATTSTLTTWDVGSDEGVTFLSRVQPLFLTKPSGGSMTNYYRENLGDALTADTVVTMDSKGRFDINNGGRSANWHRAMFTFTGAVEIQGINAEMETDSLE